MRSVEDFLRTCVAMDGSDLHFKTDTGKAYVRVHGDLIELDAPHYSNEEFRQALYRILKPAQIARFEKELELDFSFEVEGISRFRGNAYQQRNHVQAAFRVIPYEILNMEDLQLPAACYDFITRPRGLVLVTGPAGAGKSTSQAALLDRINRTQPVHIMTVEDPIEFVHGDYVALINQRELEVDTMSFTNALKYVLRQDPDVILVGEMRDIETIHLAITAAETGHLVFGTLHTIDAVQTVDRIIDVFPIHQQQQIRMQLSVNLVGVLSQTLVRRKDGRGRIAAHEVLVCTGAVRNLIRENKSYQIGSLIQTGSRLKMQSLDQSLATLVDRGLVEREDARVKAKDPMEFDRLLNSAPTKGGSTAAVPAPKPISHAARFEGKPTFQRSQGGPNIKPVDPNAPRIPREAETPTVPEQPEGLSVETILNADIGEGIKRLFRRENANTESAAKPTEDGPSVAESILNADIGEGIKRLFRKEETPTPVTPAPVTPSTPEPSVAKAAPVGQSDPPAVQPASPSPASTTSAPAPTVASPVSTPPPSSPVTPAPAPTVASPVSTPPISPVAPVPAPQPTVVAPTAPAPAVVIETPAVEPPRPITPPSQVQPVAVEPQPVQPPVSEPTSAPVVEPAKPAAPIRRTFRRSDS